jgi:hypothetical protein
MTSADRVSSGMKMRTMPRSITPSIQRGGGDDARFQPIVDAPGHGDDPRCVRRRPIVKSVVREIGEGVIVISL